jgi:ribulose 1,5-bisphosphate synthetase/thiazole synthase
MKKEMQTMTRDNSVDRRRFLVAAGAGAIGGLTRSASAQSTLKIRRQAEIPYKPDVLVVGGGPAGIGAALGAASNGANTLLIEHHAFFGGVAAWCLGMPINQMRPGGKRRSKLHELILAKLRAYGDQAVRTGEHQLWCNVDYLKVAVLDALDEVGCKYLVHTRAIDAVVEGNCRMHCGQTVWT